MGSTTTWWPASEDAVNPNQTGTKAAAHYQLSVGRGETAVIRLRLSNVAPDNPFGPGFAQIIETRRREADEFYRAITPAHVGEDAANVMRQALAGMLWSKQYYFFDVDKWLEEHGADPMQSATRQVRNREWFHMISDHIISMPDKWEYPWFAAWDLAFHTLALSIVDIDFAKQQLDLLLDQDLPASDRTDSCLRVELQRRQSAGAGLGHDLSLPHGAGAARQDRSRFPEAVFGKLTSNFGWWVNRKDRFGKNVFEGGFLGLDNIGVFDRSAPLPTGGYLEQADGTAWMALFCQNMLEIAVRACGARPHL